MGKARTHVERRGRKLLEFKKVDAVHLRPTKREDDAWFGDAVPFYWEGTWHLFYVWDQGHLILPRVCHAWGHFISKDLVHWEEAPMAIEPGEEASCGTGTVMEKDGVFHLFYLGRYFSTNGVMSETMCHATSTDLVHWTKDPKNPFSRADLTRYSVKDWRDGFPIWNPKAQEWWMLLTSSLKDGPEPFRGSVGLLASKDFENWEPRDPYWAPALGRHLECPDLFEWNGWWYLVFSGGYGHAVGTLYRKSRSMFGPWESATIDTFDGPCFYAAKTAGDANRRMIFGWTGTRKGDTDTGGMQWGGHGIMREIVQDVETGDLWVKMPEERRTMGTVLDTPALAPQMGQWSIAGQSATAEHTYDLAFATTPAPTNYMVSFTFKPSAKTQRFGMLLKTDPNLTQGYRVSVEPFRQRLMISSYGPEGKWRGYPLERPLPCSPDQEFSVRVVFSDSILEVFVNDKVALAGRYYDHKGGHIGLFVEEGAGTFGDIQVRQLPDETW